ncbi:protein of unknown function [Aminobacter niigataensis]|nr:protein of unknown function [Aminobacter niigataensis]
MNNCSMRFEAARQGRTNTKGGAGGGRPLLLDLTRIIAFDGICEPDCSKAHRQGAQSGYGPDRGC